MNLAALETALYDRLNLPSTPNADTIRRLRSHLNATHRDIMGTRQMSKFRKATMPFSTVANSPYAALPWAAAKVHYINDRTNQHRLTEYTQGEIEFMDPGLNRGAVNPEGFSVVNLAAHAYRQPTIEENVLFVSDAAGDGATKTLYIEYINAAGQYRRDSKALNGTSWVASTNSDILDIRKVYLGLTAGGETTASGNISVKNATQTVTYAVIPPGRMNPQYSVVQLYPYPTTAITLYANVDVYVETMSIAGDEPLLPDDFHEILIEGALMREHERNEKESLYDRATSRYTKKWRQLCLYASRPVNIDPQPGRWSQLGPYFPAGT